MGEKKYATLFISLSAFIVVEFAFAMVINALAGAGNNRLFTNSTAEISDYYYLEITPIGWTFAIWGIIYAWQVLWILYVLTSICRTNELGPVFLNPPIVTPFFLVMFILNLALNMTWLFLWSRQLMPWALVVIILYSFSMYIGLASNHRQVNYYLVELQKNHKLDLFLLRALIQNGIACNAAWVTIATLLNLATVLAYWVDLDQSFACTISLAVLTFEAICYFVLENFIFENSLRYTYSVWPVVIWALIGSLAQNWDPENTNSIITVSLLVLSILLFIIKILLNIYRSKTRIKQKINGDTVLTNDFD